MVFETYVTNASTAGVCAVRLSLKLERKLERLHGWHIYLPTALHSSYLVTHGRISFPTVHPKTQEAHGIIQTAVSVLAFWNVLAAETSWTLERQQLTSTRKAVRLGAEVVLSRRVSGTFSSSYSITWQVNQPTGKVL